jgi:aryl-alcohol dehydrogenase-like predicted oxidoreductase
VQSAVDASIEQSRAALGRNRLDCLLLHRASHMTAFGGAIWERLKHHVAKGWIAALGVSVQSPAEAHRALADAAVAHIQLPFNLLDWRWREASVVAVLRSRPDVTVHARSVLLQGVLAATDPRVWPAIPGVDPLRVMEWLERTAAAFGRENVTDLAFAFARGQDWIDGIVVGQETEDQLNANLKLAARPPLSREDCLKVEQSAPHVPERLLDPAQWKP